jgi:hypothetical protein
MRLPRVHTTRLEVFRVEYVSKTLLLNQLAALSSLLAGTYTICAYFMRRRKRSVITRDIFRLRLQR